jgi:glycosyltransferase domain-containing protein
MAKIILPTRNRPTSLGSVLAFLSRFFPGTSVIVADGSAENYRPQNRSVIAELPGTIDVDYRPFDPDLPFFDRILTVLASLTDDLIIMGADDDYPQMDVLLEAERVLENNPDHVSAFGAVVHLKLKSATDLTARLDHAHPVAATNAARRAILFAEWPYSTTYAVTRREHLIERYKRAKSSFLVGFYDFKTGLHDAMAGKLAVVPGISYISSHNYAHSYLRAEDPLVFLRHAGEVMRIHQQFAADLKAIDGMSDDEALALATRLLRKRIAALVDVAPHRRPGFENSRIYQMPIVQQQIADFYALFSADSPIRRAMEPRLHFIVDRLRTVAVSSDNSGEAATYETLDRQAAAGNEAEKNRQLAEDRVGGEIEPKSSAGKSLQVADTVSRGKAILARRLPWLQALTRRATPKEPVPPLHFEVTLDTIVRR